MRPPASSAATLISAWLVGRSQGSTSEKPACSPSSHCMGVRALSRALEWTIAKASSGGRPASTSAWKALRASTST